MDLLIDTHFILWYLLTPSRLDERTREVMKDPSYRAYVSVASIWEASIKAGIGKLHLPASLTEGIKETGFPILPISPDDAWEAGQLPLIHKDPFDRLLIAQAKLRDIPVLSDDAVFGKYGVHIFSTER